MRLFSIAKTAIRWGLTHGYRDDAVFYTALSRLTTIGLGPLIVIAVGAFLDSEQQGVYYVFGSLLQLRGLIDLGFSQSAQQLLANRFGNLSFDADQGVKGEPGAKSQFLNLAKFTTVGYMVIGLITFLLIGALGYLFLRHQLANHTQIGWQGAWWTMMACIGLGLAGSGIIVVADGANQVALTNRSRFWNEMASLVIFLLILALGGGLWASAAIAFMRLWVFLPVAISLGGSIHRQIRTANGTQVDFWKTIWPLQSRNMIVWGLGFLCYYVYNPLAMNFLGPSDAGVVGMSIQIATTAGGLALVWYNTKLPLFGNLAGTHNLESLRKLHQTGLRVTMILWSLISAALWLIILLARSLAPIIYTKIAGPIALAMFLGGAGTFTWNHMRASYIRAFCVEVFTPLAVTQGLLTPVILCLALPEWGVSGAAATYFLMMTLGAIWSEWAYRKFSAIH